MIMNSKYLIPISGRPNAGKTSLLNYLSHSKKPVGKYAGTTLKITLIPLIKDLYLVDLPGFGRISKRSKQVENKIKDEIILFFEESLNQILFPIHIIDISTFHFMVESLEKKGIIPLDIEMAQFISSTTKSPTLLALNKIDKASKTLMDQNLNLLQSYNLPEVEIFPLSLKSKVGCRIFRNRVKELTVQKLGAKYEHW